MSGIAIWTGGEFIVGIGLVTMGPMMFLVIGGGGVIATHHMLCQTIPFRFHRQRREVMMSRWNEQTKQTEVRFFPWESICAMTGQGSAITGGSLIGGATLFIGANDEENPGSFWAAMQLPAIHVLDAAAQWEMIRRFMEEGPQAIGEPQSISFNGLIEDYCRERKGRGGKIERKVFSPGRRFWWEINGTRLGIWRTRYETWLMKRRSRRYPEVEAWSQPLPESEWAKPSADLTYYNRMLAEHEYAEGYNLISLHEDIRVRYGADAPTGPHQAISPDEVERICAEAAGPL